LAAEREPNLKWESNSDTDVPPNAKRRTVNCSRRAANGER
jgi:hypothetical protein